MKNRMVWASILIAGLMIFTTSCKDSGIEFVWEGLEGSGSYSSDTNTSTLVLSGLVRYSQQRVSSNYLFAKLDQWLFILRDGDDMVMTVNDTNYQDLLDGLFVNISGMEEEYVYVYIETRIPMTGDIFNGRNPDSVELQMLVYDDHNNQYTLTSTAQFQFERN